MVIGAALGIGWAAVTGQITVFSPAAQAQAPVQTVPQTGSSAGQKLDVQAIANKVSPAVVDINTVIATGNAGRPTAQAAGTGIVLTSNGEVLTNNHVIQGSTSITVLIQGRSGSYTATVVGYDKSADVALIQIQGVSGLPTAQLANSSQSKVGQAVVALGNALGRNGAPSVTQGTITALNQSITASTDTGRSEQLTGLIQNNAPISQGDSGGPLVNSAGQVIGMITAAQSGNSLQSTSSDIGFAIPVNAAISVVNQIRSGQASPNITLGLPGMLGVNVQNLDAATATQLGLNVTSGALVIGVVSGSPADQAGITQNSVITAINGQSIASADALGPAIKAHKPGQTIQVTWVDQSGTHTGNATLVTGPPD